MPRIGEIKPTTTPLMPFWQTTDGTTVRLYSGDVVSVLQRMQASSVHTVITSPPYWGLRDYGTAQWSGGKEGCDHVQMEEKRKAVSGTSKLGFPSDGGPRRISDDNQYFTESKKQQYKLVCGKCGAKRIDQQIGSEPSPDCGTQGKAQCGGCFICTMVKVFRAVKRVLRSDGTLWLNLGCGYLPDGNLDATHWKTALALVADGWILRSDIPWVKRSAMPESCTNRPAKALEYVFLFSKQEGYYFDMEAIKPQGRGGWSGEDFLPNSKKDKQDRLKHTSATGASRANRSPVDIESGTGRNFRQTDLWFQSVQEPWGFVGTDTDELVGLDVTSQGYEGAHYACFPPKLITPMIKAATSEKGCCAKCGSPWVRVVSEGEKEVSGNVRGKNAAYCAERAVNGEALYSRKSITIGWQPSCTCNGRIIRQKVKVKVTRRPDDEDACDRDHSKSTNRNGKSSTTLDKGVPTVEVEEEVEKWVYMPGIPLDDHEVVPCTVLDPFIGSGTTCAVSIELGRNSIGIDLNEKYLTNNAIVRVKGALLSRPMMAHLAGVKRVNVLDRKNRR